jgi:hypothetical protein
MLHDHGLFYWPRSPEIPLPPSVGTTTSHNNQTGAVILLSLAPSGIVIKLTAMLGALSFESNVA